MSLNRRRPRKRPRSSRRKPSCRRLLLRRCFRHSQPRRLFPLECNGSVESPILYADGIKAFALCHPVTLQHGPKLPSHQK